MDCVIEYNRKNSNTRLETTVRMETHVRIEMPVMTDMSMQIIETPCKIINASISHTIIVLKHVIRSYHNYNGHYYFDICRDYSHNKIALKMLLKVCWLYYLVI